MSLCCQPGLESGDIVECRKLHMLRKVDLFGPGTCRQCRPVACLPCWSTTLCALGVAPGIGTSIVFRFLRLSQRLDAPSWKTVSVLDVGTSASLALRLFQMHARHVGFCWLCLSIVASLELVAFGCATTLTWLAAASIPRCLVVWCRALTQLCGSILRISQHPQLCI